MMLLAKAALGLGGTLVLAGAYTMREGVIRIDVDEYRSGVFSHVHMWVPAPPSPWPCIFVPANNMRCASEQAREALPILHALRQELKKISGCRLREIVDHNQHVRMRMRGGRCRLTSMRRTRKFTFFARFGHRGRHQPLEETRPQHIEFFSRRPLSVAEENLRRRVLFILAAADSANQPVPAGCPCLLKINLLNTASFFQPALCRSRSFSTIVDVRTD